MTDKSRWQDVISRTLSVITESDGADEHADLIADLRLLLRELTDHTTTVLEDAPETADARAADPLALAVHQAVVEHLIDLGATLEYPGFVNIPIRPNHLAAFGTANAVWGGDLTDLDGDPCLGLSVGLYDIPASSTDVDAIVAGIRDAVKRVKGCVLDLHDYDSPDNLDGGHCRTCGTPRHRSRTF